MADSAQHAPRLSIVTVCFDAARGIEATLRSLERLSFRDFEHVVIDGGSTDGTLEILRRAGDRITTLVSEPDRGIFDAMNKGIARARGEFLWFLNAGDTVRDADFLDALDWSRDFHYGGAVLCEGGRETKRLMPRARIGRWSSLRGQVACHQSMIVRRSLAPAYDLRYRHVGDFDWSLRILQTPGLRIGFVPRYWVDYEVGGFTSRNAAACWRENFAIFQRQYGAWSLPIAAALWLRFWAGRLVRRLWARVRPAPATRAAD